MTARLRVVTPLSFLAFILMLAACGGGGGGGGSSNAVIGGGSGTPTAISVSVGPGGASASAPVLATDATLATAPGVTYPGYTTVARLAGTDPSAVKTSLTNNAAATFDVTLSGSVDNTPFSERFTQANVIATGANSSAAQKTGADGNTYSLVLAGTDLSYARYGYWERGNGDNLLQASEVSAVVFGGRETPAGNMPVAGTATYSGRTFGLGIDPAGNIGGISGNVTLTANFGTQTVNGNVSSLVNASNQALDVKASLVGNISGNAFLGNLQATNLAGTQNLGSGVFDGKFFGPAAQEVAGKWNYNGNDGSKWMGAFGAK